MSTPDRRAGLDRAHPDLSIRRQCTLLSISRSGVYRCARPGNDDDDLGLMRRIDELFLAYPFLGSRRMAAMLSVDGERVNRKRVQRRRDQNLHGRSWTLGMDNVFIERLWRSFKHEDIYLKGYADGREAKAGIGDWIAFYNSRRPHQALGNRTPMTLWREGTTGPLAENAVDMMDNARAWPTCPQPKQQQTFNMIS